MSEWQRIVFRTETSHRLVFWHDNQGHYAILPREYEILHRDRPEPITKAALAREGFVLDDTMVGLWKIKCTDGLGGTRYLFWHDENGNSLYPGCKTMRQLLELVVMLGGKE